MLEGGHWVVGDEFVVAWVAQGCGCSHVQKAETGLLVFAGDAFVAADIKGPVVGECPAHEVSARWQAGLLAYGDLQGFRGGLDCCGVMPVRVELGGGFLYGRVQVGESQG
jgi:hypothetical protein